MYAKNLTTKLQTIRKRSSEEGFTLIELLIAVIIIGILAAIAVPIFANQTKGAINASVKSDVANARSFIPGQQGKVKPLDLFQKQVSVTDNNNALYVISANSQDACYQVSHRYSDTETTNYRYLTTEGVVKEGTCTDFNTLPGVTSVKINDTTDSSAAPAPQPSTPAATTPNPAPTQTVTPTQPTTNEYVDGKVGIASMNTDWNGVYTAQVTITPKQNRAVLWTIKWTDPSVTGIQSTNGQMNCNVATGGAITCSGIPNHYSTDNLQWGNTFSQSVQLQTTNKSTAPANPVVAVTATPK